SRLTLAAALAVAVAVAAGAAATYLIVRSELRDEVDSSLRDRVASAVAIVPARARRLLTIPRLPPPAFGGAPGYVQLVTALGTGVARAALAPLRQLSEAASQVTRTRDLSRRVEATGRDELGRLAASFNTMLGALDESMRAQRQLVADASHELRTPLTSLRTNLELLERGQPTDPVERQQLLGDLVTQMERLTTLVGDLIEVARDEETPMPFEQLQLDEVVHEVVDDVSFRYPKVRFNVTSAPSSINGVKVRVARAITNLLDNA